jgi:septal ring factor EnvC (AmiA/AmiB activator)
MLKTKSFELMDDVGMNELLNLYPLAQGASIFVSDGKICIPYEDGEPENDSQRSIKIKTEINTMLRQIGVIEHAQRVMQSILSDLDVKMAEATADLASNKTNKAFEKRVAELKDAVTHAESQVRQNTAQIEKMQLEIKLYREAL